MAFEGSLSNNLNIKTKKISDLKMAIAHAERMQDEERVIMLETELRAVEKGEEFDRQEFLIKKTKQKLNQNIKF